MLFEQFDQVCDEIVILELSEENSIKKLTILNAYHQTVGKAHTHLAEIDLRQAGMPGETRLRHLLLLGILLCFSEFTGSARAQCGPAAAEQSRLERQNKLAMYKVTLKTYWSRARFPRHYPEWRPQAQFGKLV
ncbi:hypothetical protein TSAR_016146, partial [Trichomalopsis sarcophagae]